MSLKLVVDNTKRKFVKRRSSESLKAAENMAYTLLTLSIITLVAILLSSCGGGKESVPDSFVDVPEEETPLYLYVCTTQKTCRKLLPGETCYGLGLKERSGHKHLTLRGKCYKMKCAKNHANKGLAPRCWAVPLPEGRE